MLKDLIKELREKKNYTIKDLSNKSGISTVEIRNIEAGKNKPSASTIWKLSQALDYDYEILFEALKE